jgi:hypothetical protein
MYIPGSDQNIMKIIKNSLENRSFHSCCSFVALFAHVVFKRCLGYINKKYKKTYGIEKFSPKKEYPITSIFL